MVIAGAIYNVDFIDSGSDNSPKFLGINAAGNIAIAYDDYNGPNKYYYRLSVNYTSTQTTSLANRDNWTITNNSLVNFGWIQKLPLQSTTKINANKFGILTNNPLANFHVNGSSQFDSNTTFRNHSPQLITDNSAGWYATSYMTGVGGGAQSSFQRADGTELAPTNVKTNMTLGAFSFRGHNGTAFTASRGYIQAAATEDWTASANGTQLRFGVTPNGSTTLNTIGMVLSSDAKLGLGTTAPIGDIQIQRAGDTVIRLFNTTANYWDIANKNLGFLHFERAGIQHMTLSQIGLLGINNINPASRVDIVGSLALPIKTVTTNYTATIDDHTIIVNNGGTAVTINLPSPGSCPGRIYIIKRADNTSTGAITISATSIENSNGTFAASTTLDTYASTGGAYGVRKSFQSNTTNYVLIN